MLIRQANQKSLIFVTPGIFKIKGLNINQISANDLEMMSMNLSQLLLYYGWN